VPPRPAASPHGCSASGRTGCSQVTLAIPVLFGLAGAGLGAVLLAVDGVVGPDALPRWLRFGQDNARALLSSVIGGLLTVVVLIFWVRMVAVQMTSSMFSASILQTFLHDRFQQMVMGAVIGALTYTMVVSQAVPDAGVGRAAVPHLSVAVAMLAIAAVAVLVVESVSEGARMISTGTMLRQLSEDVTTQVHATHPERDTAHGPSVADVASPEPPARPAYVVVAGGSGWVQRLDEDRILVELPPGAVAELSIRVGHFITEGTPLCRVWPAEGEIDPGRTPEPGVDLAAGVEAGVRAAVALGDGPTLEQDVAYGLRMLSDVAERALAPATGESSAAEQAIMRLGVVLRAVLLRDLPARTRQDDQQRMLLRPHELEPSDYVDRAFTRVRQAGAASPAVAVALLDTLRMLRDELVRVGRDAWVPPLERQAALVVEGAAGADLTRSDLEYIRDRAVQHELVVPAEPRGGDGAGEPAGNRPGGEGVAAWSRSH
jgi:uncharacterized membrane protein